MNTLTTVPSLPRQYPMRTPQLPKGLRNTYSNPQDQASPVQKIEQVRERALLLKEEIPVSQTVAISPASASKNTFSVTYCSPNLRYTAYPCVGVPKGRGKVEKNKEEYEGELLLGKKHGEGTLKTPTTKYTGFFENGEKEGQGVLENLETQSIYTGSFHKDQMQGQGILSTNEGTLYSGEFLNNQYHGWGKLSNSRNPQILAVAEGYREKGMPAGALLTTLCDDEGSWKGVQLWSKRGLLYQLPLDPEEFSLRDPQLRCDPKNRTIYFGSFDDQGRRHGRGIEVNNSSIYVGEWRSGELQEDKKEIIAEAPRESAPLCFEDLL